MKARTSASVSAGILPAGKVPAARSSRPSSDSGPSWLIFSQPPAASCSKALIRPSGAAQAEGIALAGGRQADGPDADQRFGAFGDEQRGGGQRVGVDRGVAAVAVLGAQRLDHAGRFAVAGRVVRAHDALQLGELAHHVRAQIGLGQQGGAVGGRDVAAQLLRHAPGDGAHALDAFELGAQLVVVDDSAQLLDARGQRRLAVGVEEELRVGQARADHALVAFDDVHRIGRACCSRSGSGASGGRWPVRTAGSTSGSGASSGSGIPAALAGIVPRTRPRRRWDARPAR